MKKLVELLSPNVSDKLDFTSLKLLIDAGTLPQNPDEINTSIKDLASDIIKKSDHNLGPEIGNVERKVFETVLDAYPYTPRPIPVSENEPELLDNLKLDFENGNFTGIIRTFVSNKTKFENQPSRGYYLAKCRKYRDLAESELQKAKSLKIRSPEIKRMLQRAQRAYDDQDYITSIYYARYVVLKNPIGLDFQYRHALAVLLVALGVYLHLKDKRAGTEELI